MDINQKITLKSMMIEKSVFNTIKKSAKNIRRFYEILENGNGWEEVRMSFFDTKSYFRCIYKIENTPQKFK